jgi:hypothetical protein
VVEVVVNVVVDEVGVAHEVVVVDNIEVVVVVVAEEEDGSTDSGCGVANAENNVEVVAYAVVAIALGAVGSHIDLVVVVQSDLLLVVQVVVLVVGNVDYLFEIFVEASLEEECWEVDYN